MGTTLEKQEIEKISLRAKKEKKKEEYWHYSEFKDYTNEEIVKLIQATDNPIYWEELDHRTKKLYSSVMKNHVHDYYKQNMREDIMTVLKIGWVKAVNTYDENKATAEFIPYCSFLMQQQYKMFARRITEEKVGNSVRDEALSCVTADGHEDNDKMLQGCIDIIMKYECEEYSEIENKDFVNDILERLKSHDEIQYTIIKKHCVKGITQKELGQTLGMSQSAISRHIKKGVAFLKKELAFEEIMINV